MLRAQIRIFHIIFSKRSMFRSYSSDKPYSPQTRPNGKQTITKTDKITHVTALEKV